MSAQLRQAIGYGIVLASIAAFFWWGYQFETWGKHISFDPAFLGFVSWFPVGAFGTGYAVGGFSMGLRYAGSTTGLLGVALLIGLLSGSYT